MKIQTLLIITTILCLFFASYDFQGKQQKLQTDLFDSVIENNFEKLQKLIDAGASVNELNNQHESALYKAILNQQDAIAKLLISKGANVDLFGPKGTTPLHEAVFQRNYEMVKLLLAHGADVNRSNSHGLTPLHFAAMNEAPSIAELLIRFHADINKQSHEGWSPLHTAVVYGGREVLKVLLDHGCFINLQDYKGKTPLLLAMLQKRSEATKILILSGADVNIEDNQGNYPLLLAARYGDTECAKMLLEKGGTVLPDQIKHDSEEMNPLFYTKMYRMKNHKLFSKLLKSYSPELDELEKEHIHLKRVGHAWKIDGKYTVIPKVKGYPKMNVRILGGRSSLFYRAMAKGTRHYIALNGPGNDPFFEDLHEMVEFASESYQETDQSLLMRIRNGKPTPIHIGWNREIHQVELLIWDRWLLISNRGVGSKKPIEVFCFDPKLMHTGIIRKITNLDGASREEFEKIFFVDFIKELGLKKDMLGRLIEERTTLSNQIVDNCAWESAEGIAYAFFLLEKLKPFWQVNVESKEDLKTKIFDIIHAQEKEFSKWLMFQQLDVLERYVRHHLEENSPYLCNMELISAILKKIKDHPAAYDDKDLFHKLQIIQQRLEFTK